VDSIVVEGGERLTGAVTVSGAKNAALPILASAILTGGTNVFRKVPALHDILTTQALLEHMGAELAGTMSATGTVKVTIPDGGLTRREAPYELVKTMRASTLVLGPLVARYGEAHVSMPGGCAIGARPIDQHLKGLEAMGAQVELDHGYVNVTCKRLRGAEVVFDMPTVTGTENLMMAAALAKGTTILENAAREPEVEELGRVLIKMGARITGAGTDRVIIEGVDELHPIEHAIIPDRIEAGTFMVAAAVTGGDVLVEDCLPDHMDSIVGKLRQAGVDVQPEGTGVRVKASKPLKAIDIITQPYPGFPTDMQAQFMVLMAVAQGQSRLTETIFENRFMHVPELGRMGCDIQVAGRVATIRGVPRLSGATVMATDLRASASLVIAGLVAEGRTEVLRVYHLDRGYERLERKLKKLGARIKRVANKGA
jgi:UDP-N-acetylglucosamine 1-carboxyvinyltransferase